MNSESPFPPAAEAGPDTVDVDADVTEVEILQPELAQQKEAHLQLAADFENFKRRSREDSDTRALAQKQSFIVELLPVLDNLERALAAGASAGSVQFRQGVEMTLQQLRQLLRQHGIESDEIVGQPFDPHQHEALAPGHDPAKPDHAILELIQRGYRRGTKVVRPAKVVVNDLTEPKPARHGH